MYNYYAVIAGLHKPAWNKGQSLDANYIAV